jgi:hypothetical protein
MGPDLHERCLWTGGRRGPDSAGSGRNGVAQSVAFTVRVRGVVGAST